MALKPNVPKLLSLNAGFVDTMGFLMLHGLFTAHVTGNFVTLGASMAQGASGAVAKLLALPVFCVVVIAMRLLRYWLLAWGLPVLRTFLGLMLILLIVSAALAIYWGPFHDGDTWQAIATGMMLVTAMSIQNAVQKVHLSNAPPTTLMTGTTTQIMLDVADLLHGASGQQLADIKARLSVMASSLAAFAIGCMIGALAYLWVGVWCAVIPPLLVLWTSLLRDAVPAAIPQ